MKKITILVISILTLVGASVTMAGPPAGGWHKQKSLSTVEDFKGLKAGDQIAKVCKKCDTISILEIKSEEEAMEICKAGKVIDCPSCENKAKVIIHKGPRNDRKVVRYVDEHGEECMFIAKVDPPKTTAHKHEHR